MKVSQLIEKLQRYANVDPNTEVELVTQMRSGGFRTAEVRHVFIGVSDRLNNREIVVKLSDNISG